MQRAEMVGFQQTDERLELVVLRGFHGAEQAEKFGERVHVGEGVADDFADVVIVRRELVGEGFGEQVFGEKIFRLVFVGVARPKLLLVRVDVADAGVGDEEVEIRGSARSPWCRGDN